MSLVQILPAIGFACEVESLLSALDGDVVSPRAPIDVKIQYGAYLEESDSSLRMN